MKLRAIVNLLSDEKQAHAAAHILSREAKERGVLIADLVSEALTPDVAPPPPPPPSPPVMKDVEDDFPRVRGKRINSEFYGLRTWIEQETDKAWLVQTVFDDEVWLPKSQCAYKGDDAKGRAIIIIPMWLVRKKEMRIG